MKKILFFGGIMFLFPVVASAMVSISAVFPNTDTDPDWEYFEIQNIWCADMTLSGYSITDAANVRTFIFSDEVLWPHEIRVLPHWETLLELNNRNETLFIMDPDGEVIDSFFYASSERNVRIERDLDLEICDPDQWSTPDPDDPPNSDPPPMDPNPDDPPDDPDTGSGNVNDPITIWTGSLDAEKLGYQDSDGDGRIDTILLHYNELLTGSVNTEAFFLSSAANGLYHEAIHQASEYILSGSLDENSITLSIVPSDFIRETLTINATVRSALRIRTNGDIGVTTVFGQPLEPLYLTRSFDRYRSIDHPVDIIDDPESELPDRRNTSPSIPDRIVFPEVIPVIQRPFDAEWNDGRFICTRIPCRINLTFDEIFSTHFPRNAYHCEMTSMNSVSHSCNPPEWKFEQSGTIQFRLIHRASGQSREYSWYVDVDQVVPLESQTKTTKKSNESAEMSTWQDELVEVTWEFMIPEIILQNTDVMSEVSPGVYQCRTKTKTCSLNLALNMTDSRISYHWLYPDGTQLISTNPRSKSFAIGHHIIWLQAIHTESGEVLWETNIEVHVEQITTVKAKKSSTSPKKSTSSKWKKSTKTTSSWSSTWSEVHTRETVHIETDTAHISLSGLHSSLIAVLLWSVVLLGLGRKPEN